MSIERALDPDVDLLALPARDRILTTAYRLFYRDGIRASGIDRVIAEASVSKVTFYRHFASKDLLVVAVLDLRHERWMRWFRDALDRQSSSRRPPIASALEEWLTSASFRGCAFINSVGELGSDLPVVHDIARRHKADMVAAIENSLPTGPDRACHARALGVAVDGAIVHAQYTRDAAAAIEALATVASSLNRSG